MQLPVQSVTKVLFGILYLIELPYILDKWLWLIYGESVPHDEGMKVFEPGFFNWNIRDIMNCINQTDLINRQKKGEATKKRNQSCLFYREKDLAHNRLEHAWHNDLVFTSQNLVEWFITWEAMNIHLVSNTNVFCGNLHFLKQDSHFDGDFTRLLEI